MSPAAREQEDRRPAALAEIGRLVASTPVRLSKEERVILGVVEGALEHSEFTANVDVSASMHYVRETYDKDERVRREIEELARVLCGLVVCNDFRKKHAARLLGGSLEDNMPFLASCFEIGRRFKQLNPDKMRDTYGKLLYILMDASTPRRFHYSLHKPVVTVKELLEKLELHNDNFLKDPALVDATRQVGSTRDLLPGESLESVLAAKSTATQYLMDRYVKSTEDGEELQRVLVSIGDSLSFLKSNRDPIQKLIHLLRTKFRRHEPGNDPDLSLDLRRVSKPRHELNHDHSTQFVFVLQSLSLWARVMDNFFALWQGAESDLLNPRNGYQLANTGQGMQRCQSAPATRENMHALLRQVERECEDRWVGLQVVHLGDREVPNALIFIDKYTQIPRILNPVVRCLEAIENELAHDPATKKYLDQVFGGPERCVKLILADMFRGGFDGGGDLGGSCIDGRLTSLWNWASLIEKKSFYPVFLMSGFLGFDGQF